MDIYVYNEFSSKYTNILNDKIIKELNSVYNNLIIYDLCEFQEHYSKLEIEHLIISGGDGTLHNVVNLVKDHLDKIIIGYIPTGTANDFGNSYGIKNIDQALNIIKSKNIQEISIMKLDDTLVLYGVSIGKMSEVSLKTKKKSKKLFGKLIYKIKGIKYLFCKKSFVKVMIENQVFNYNVKALLAVNTKYLGGVKVNTKLSKEKISVLPIKNIFDLIKIFIFGRFKKIKSTNAREIILESENIWCVDGEKIDIKKAKLSYNQNKIRLLSKNT